MQSSLIKLIVTSGITNMSDGIALVAWSWLATLLTRDPSLIALVPVAVSLPWFVLSMPAGIIIDRYDYRRVILIADIFRCTAYGILAVVILITLPFSPPLPNGTEHQMLFLLVAICAITIGAAEVLRDNAAQSFLPSLVPPEKLEYANSRLLPTELVMNLLVGTAIAGVLIDRSIVLPFAVNTILMAIAVFIFFTIPGKFQSHTHPRPSESNWRKELSEAIRFLLTHKILLSLAIISGAGNFVFFGLLMSVVLVVQEQLFLGPLALSAILASGALGAIAAGALHNWISPRFEQGAILQAGLISMLAFPITVLLAGPGIAGLILICVGFFINEFWGITANTINVSYRQHHIPPELMGRVISIIRCLIKGASPLGMLAAGLLIDVTEGIYGRETALMAPYLLSLLLYSLIAALAWGFYDRWFKTR